LSQVLLTETIAVVISVIRVYTKIIRKLFNLRNLYFALSPEKKQILLTRFSLNIDYRILSDLRRYNLSRHVPIAPKTQIIAIFIIIS
jgi:hypothetical protein